MFSHLSVNNDEAAYLLQAKALASGHLFPPAGDPASSFTPWLGVVDGDHYVLKYTPVVAAFLALSLVLTGGYAAALGCWAAALVGVTYLLAKEVTQDRPTAAIAAVVAAAAPLTIIQSALALPYVPFLVIIELALWTLLVGARRGSIPLLATSGLCSGLGFATRSYDAILIVAPTLGWLLWTKAGQRRRLLVGVFAGALLPAAGLLWFDYVATGSALKLPFSLFSTDDTLGFGEHRLYPEEPARHFGLAQGWQGLWRHLSLLGVGWALGGVVLLGVVAVALRRRVPSACLSLLAGGLLLTFGYLFFWGTWNAAVIWGAVDYIGPYYLLPLMIPLSIIGAIGLRSLAASTRLGTAVLSVAACVLSAIVLIPAARDNLAFEADNAQLAHLVSAQGRGLFFVDTYPNYLAHPSAVVANGATPGGKTVFALQRGSADFTVLHSFADRPVYLLDLLGEYGKHPNSGFGATLQRLTTVAGPELHLTLRARLPEAVTSAELVVSVGSRTQVLNLPVGQDDDVSVAFASGAVSKPRSGPSLSFSQLQPAADGLARVTLITHTTPDAKAATTQLSLPLVAQDGELTMLLPTGYVTKIGPSEMPPLSVLGS